MALMITRNGADWIEASDTGSACWGYDTVLGKVIYRLPSGTSWVDAAGNVISANTVGFSKFDIAENGGLLAAL